MNHNCPWIYVYREEDEAMATVAVTGLRRRQTVDLTATRKGAIYRIVVRSSSI